MAIGTQTIKGFIQHQKQLEHHVPSCQIDNEDHHHDIEYLELEGHFNEDANERKELINILHLPITFYHDLKKAALLPRCEPLWVFRLASET